MMLKLGKYGANFNATGAIAPGSQRWQGAWHIYDIASGSGQPFEEGECEGVRDNQYEAIEDGRIAALSRLEELNDEEE